MGVRMVRPARGIVRHRHEANLDDGNGATVDALETVFVHRRGRDVARKGSFFPGNAADPAIDIHRAAKAEALDNHFLDIHGLQYALGKVFRLEQTNISAKDIDYTAGTDSPQVHLDTAT